MSEYCGADESLLYDEDPVTSSSDSGIGGGGTFLCDLDGAFATSGWNEGKRGCNSDCGSRCCGTCCKALICMHKWK